MSAGKQKMMSLEDKMLIIRKFDKIRDPFQKMQFKNSDSTIQNIISNRKTILSKYGAMKTKLAAARKTIMIANDKPNYTAEKHAFLEKILIEWYQRAEIHVGLSRVTVMLLKEKTYAVMKFLNIDSLPPSDSHMTILKINCQLAKHKRTNGFKSLSLNIRKIAEELLEREGISKEKALAIFGKDILKIAKKREEEDDEIFSITNDKFSSQYQTVNRKFTVARELFELKSTSEQLELLKEIIKYWFLGYENDEITIPMLKRQVNIAFMLLGIEAPIPTESWLHSVQTECFLAKKSQSFLRKPVSLSLKESAIHVLLSDKNVDHGEHNTSMQIKIETVADIEESKPANVSEPLILRIEYDTNEENQEEVEAYELYEVVNSDNLQAESDKNTSEILYIDSDSGSEKCSVKEEDESDNDIELEIMELIEDSRRASSSE